MLPSVVLHTVSGGAFPLRLFIFDQFNSGNGGENERYPTFYNLRAPVARAGINQCQALFLRLPVPSTKRPVNLAAPPTNSGLCCHTIGRHSTRQVICVRRTSEIFPVPGISSAVAVQRRACPARGLSSGVYVLLGACTARTCVRQALRGFYRN